MVLAGARDIQHGANDRSEYALIKFVSHTAPFGCADAGMSLGKHTATGSGSCWESAETDNGCMQSAWGNDVSACTIGRYEVIIRRII